MIQSINGKHKYADKRKRPEILSYINFETDRAREEYRKKKKEDEDTIERRGIYAEIKRLIRYGLPQTEVVERLKEKFPNSKYQMFFQN